MAVMPDVLCQEYIPSLSTVLSITISVLLAAFLWNKRKPKVKLPPGPWGLPIVGYLPFLGKEPYRTLDNLSKIYGSIFSLYLGRTHVVILGDYATVREAFSKWATTDRPPELFSFLPNAAGLSSVNGQEWVEQRRFSVNAMRKLGLGRSTWIEMIEEEISELLPLIQGYKGQPVDISQFLTSSVSNNIYFLLFGKRLPFGDPNRKFLDRCLDDVMRVFNQAGLHIYFPWIAKLMVKLNTGGYTKSSRILKKFNDYIRKEIELHKSREKQFSKNFIDDYLDEIEVRQKEDPDTTFNEGNLIGNTQALFLGGSDTTRTSLSWLILAMATYPNIQKTVHDELDSVLGKGQKASWEDRCNFPYSYAVIMEGQRWKTVAPLNTSRIARENIKLGDFDIPKGTTIIANNWAVHNDARFWKDPEKFIPERFLLNKGREVCLKPENYVPFSYGKRNCPAETVAMMELFLYFTALLQSFEIRTPTGASPCLDGVLGLTYQPFAQKLCFVPRSS